MSSKASHVAHSKRRKKEKHRSTLLSVVLIFVIIHGLLLTILSIGEKNYQGEVTHPIMVATFILGSFLHAVAGVGLWKWKKWGLNLYLAAATMTAIAALINTGSMLVVFAAFIPLAVVGYIVRREWHNFE